MEFIWKPMAPTNAADLQMSLLVCLWSLKSIFMNWKERSKASQDVFHPHKSSNKQKYLSVLPEILE